MVTITPSLRETTYTPVSPTTDFPVGFPIFGRNAGEFPASDIEVTVAGEKRTDFTITGSFVDGVSTDAIVRMNVGVTGDVIIRGKRTPRRTDQYANAGPLPIRDHNYALNRLESEVQEVRRDTDRNSETVDNVIGTVTDLTEIAVGAADTATEKSEVAASAADRAEASAAGVNLPPIASSDAGKPLVVKDDGTGYEIPDEGFINYSSQKISRGGTFIGVGQQADFDGFGRGGLAIGAGWDDRGTGSRLSADGHGNWINLQSMKDENPTEFIIYPTAAQGYANSVAGTGNISRVSGTTFKSRWVGGAFYFLRKKFVVAAVIDQNTLTLREVGGGAVNFPTVEKEAFNYFYTSGTGICRIEGTLMTRLSGDPLPPLFFTDFQLTVGGTVVSVASRVSVNQYVLSTAPGDGEDISFSWRGNINDQLATVRVQAILGNDEENLNFLAIAGNSGRDNSREFAIRTGIAGQGKFRPILFGSGSWGASDPRDALGIYPPNTEFGGTPHVSVGGPRGREVARFYGQTVKQNTNRLDFYTGGTGSSPSVRSRGVDPNIGMSFDVFGTGSFSVSANDFASTLFRVSITGMSSFLLPQYSSDTDAATAGVPVGGWYQNLTSGAIRQRRS
ncbi:hypothetical protein ACTOV4_00660 [Brucella sp. C7-11G]